MLKLLTSDPIEGTLAYTGFFFQIESVRGRNNCWDDENKILVLKPEVRFQNIPLCKKSTIENPSKQQTIMPHSNAWVRPQDSTGIRKQFKYSLKLELDQKT